MKWKLVSKKGSSQPTTGTYTDWKSLLANEGFHQCVYCALPDAALGGERNFHVEHYKPKSKAKFKHLENKIKNLFYACPICNVFKSDKWPATPKKDHSVAAYPDPSKIDYNILFQVSELTGTITGKFVASKYLIESLHLNRPQLIFERRIYSADERSLKIVQSVRSYLKRLQEAADEGDRKASEYLTRLNKLMCDIHELNTTYRRTPTYIPKELC